MTSHSRVRRPAAILSAAALLPILAACTHTDTTGSVYPSDFRERHPIVLAETPRVLDVFVQGSRGYDDRERQDVAAFLADYRRRGSGPLMIQVPVGTGQDAAIRAAAVRIRSAGAGRASVSTYQPADPAMASPIRLSFRTLQAQVGGPCGLWPQDLGVNDVAFNESNKPYWNFGCSVQANVASQIADPVDLVRGRQGTPPDTLRRMSNIEKIRSGTDPSTSYKTEAQSVRQGISQ